MKISFVIVFDIAFEPLGKLEKLLNPSARTTIFSKLQNNNNNNNNNTLQHSCMMKTQMKA